MKQNKDHCAQHYINAIKQPLLKWMGVTATFQCMTQMGLLLSCDNSLKFDWYYQISGSKSTCSSLNSWNLHDHIIQYFLDELYLLLLSDLSEAVDVYSDWIDACEAANS